MLNRVMDKMLEKARAKNGVIRHQKAAIEAVDTFLRRSPHVTKAAPHTRDALDLKRLMLIVVVALLPCLLFGIYNTGRQAYLSIGDRSFTFLEAFFEGAIHVLPLVIISYAAGGLCEMVFAQIRKHEIAEGFLVTGMLYPLICPATIPWWMFALGIMFGVVIGKEVFGGTGQNFMNPALVARAFLFFAYPASMSGDIWIKTPFTRLNDGSLVANSYTTIASEKISAFISGTTPLIDGFSGASLLGVLSENRPGVDSLKNFHDMHSFSDMFYGFIPGSIGETSTLMCLIGAVLLIVTKVASWRTMAGVLAGGLVMSSLFYFGADTSSPPAFLMTPLEHLVVGGFMFGAIFMATDPVSSPLLNSSRLIYGFLIGCLCVLIRLINPAYPEGMMLAILFMNIFASLIDHYVLIGMKKRRDARAF
jgi:Na+-transporting NADH:ubiquinone oxidoreductase subunit B